MIDTNEDFASEAYIKSLMSVIEKECEETLNIPNENGRILHEERESLVIIRDLVQTLKKEVLKERLLKG